MLKMIGDFLLSAWIWNITFDRFHPLITGIILFCLLRFFVRRKRLESLLITINAQLFSFGLLTAIVVYGLIGMFDWCYEPLRAHEAVKMISIIIPSLSVAVVYAISQSILFLIGRLFWRYNVGVLVMMVWISNGISLGISYVLISMMELWHYAG